MVESGVLGVVVIVVDVAVVEAPVVGVALVDLEEEELHADKRMAAGTTSAIPATPGPSDECRLI